jgi:type IV pilus assembly protein PilM
MALPNIDGGLRKKRDQMLAVDLGSRTTKAVQIHRRGNKFALSRYAILDAPIFDRAISAEMLADHLRSVAQAMETKVKPVALTLNVNDAMVRHVEMPRMPVEDMRLILKHNSKTYLQQDMPNHVFDCHFLPGADGGKGAAQKQKVLVAAAKQQLLTDLTDGAKSAGLVADAVIPGLVGPVNAFEAAMPDVFSNQVVALVDIGFKSSSICVLQQGELVLSRVVTLGGDKLTTAVADMMSISYAEAEGIKVGMAGEVQSALESVLMPLGRELRASIDFFEHQHDRPVSAVYVAGGSARSEFIVQTLQTELMLECKQWNPAASLDIDLSSQQRAEIEQVAPQLAVAIGAALSAF